jgi:exosortase K
VHALRPTVDEVYACRYYQHQPEVTSMRSPVTRVNMIQFAVVIAVAGGLKLFFSTASVDELRWVLAPTTLLVELITGERFFYESYAGYMISDHSFIIAPACSGLNFLITAFAMLATVRLWKHRESSASPLLVPAALGASYLATIVVNAVRIAIALHLHRTKPGTEWISAEQLHRLEGIFVYFGALLILFLISEGIDRISSKHPTSTARLIYLPLVIYWVVTLGIPIANGAYRERSGFWSHVVVVLAIPLMVMLPLKVIYKTSHGKHERH